MNPLSSFHLMLLAIILDLSSGQCPKSVRTPCSCASTRYETVSITCTGASSLAVVLQAIGKPSVVIDSLLITNSPIKKLPAFAFQGYSVKRLVLRNNSMTDVDGDAFEGAIQTTLEELELRDNLLSAIPQQGVTKLTSLITLILAKNQIENVAKYSFKDYRSKHILRKLDMSSNRLTNVGLDPNSFDGLASIQELNFDKNFLTSIPTDSLKPLTSLEDLSLGVNQLETISIGALVFPNLKSLSLEVNRVKAIEPEALQGVPNLLYLYLSTNKFLELNGDTFRYVPQLKVLAMGNNEIANIPSNAFRFVPSLVRLELSNCKIDTIEPGAFQTTSKIQVIVLTKNNLRIVSRNMFQGLGELYSLDLKGNNISLVEDRAWSKLPGLRHLDISANKISHLGPLTFAGTFEKSSPTTTRILYIYENPWVCNEQLEWFRGWLRDNDDLIIDAPGYAMTVCNKPEKLLGIAIKTVDNTTDSGSVLNKQMPPQKPKKSENTRDLLQLGTKTESAAGAPKMSGVNIMALILGIVLGVFLLTLVLLMITRYFVSKSRRDHKVEDEDMKRFGSTISGYHSTTGSVYPSPPLPPHQPGNPALRSQYYLSRPWYWWF